ncbi:hypothetical protein [Petroclostridium sp. X23]|uniref:hypothetical protein n=1 Tax=Petroclostridium sp. X23 TaxID=3045146 RepID=UPI0024AE5C80|nr:hypothetical protein [Petroclostridium sp. X23]WHH60403.1 hypothetical protein QKW49_06675 [Petroclostridium sp. X23]
MLLFKMLDGNKFDDMLFGFLKNNTKLKKAQDEFEQQLEKFDFDTNDNIASSHAEIVSIVTESVYQKAYQDGQRDLISSLLNGEGDIQ